MKPRYIILAIVIAVSVLVVLALWINRRIEINRYKKIQDKEKFVEATELLEESIEGEQKVEDEQEEEVEDNLQPPVAYESMDLEKFTVAQLKEAILYFNKDGLVGKSRYNKAQLLEVLNNLIDDKLTRL
jgi:FtsZ-interacting cell division protein ZipA